MLIQWGERSQNSSLMAFQKRVCGTNKCTSMLHQTLSTINMDFIMHEINFDVLLLSFVHINCQGFVGPHISQAFIVQQFLKSRLLCTFLLLRYEWILSLWHWCQCVKMPVVWDRINVTLIWKNSVLDYSLSGGKLLVFSTRNQVFITPRASDTDYDKTLLACCYVMFLSSACTFLCSV